MKLLTEKNQFDIRRKNAYVIHENIIWIGILIDGIFYQDG